MPKKDLYLSKPLLNTAGFLGYYPNTHNQAVVESLSEWGGLAALVSDPISYLPRKFTEEGQFINTDGGTLLHNGLPNPGFWQVLKVAAPKWNRSSLPIIPHLLGEEVERTIKMVRALESVENVMAVELGLPFFRGDQPAVWLEAMAALQVEMPIIINMPLHMVELYGERFIKKGASAISLRAPRGRVAVATDEGLKKLKDEEDEVGESEPLVGRKMVSGRLFGGQLFAQSCEVIYRGCKAGLPMIAGVGFDTLAKVEWAIAEGAMAVQVDLVCWR